MSYCPTRPSTYLDPCSAPMPSFNYSSGRVISPMLEGTYTWQHTTLIRDRHPCFQRDSNPKPQQASGSRPTSGIELLSLYPWGKPGTHRTGIWENLGAGLDSKINIASTGIRFRDLPSRSQSLHQLLYHSRLYWDVWCLNS
jgi:hypothetical protein